MPALAPLLAAFRDSLQAHGTSGIVPTGVPGVTFFWNDSPVPRAPLLYDPGLVIVAQGGKTGYLGGRQFEYGANTCLVLGVPVPFECEVHATPQEPLLGLRVDVDLSLLHNLVARFQGQLALDGHARGTPHSAVEPVRLDGTLLSATIRLVECLRDPIDRQVIGPAAVEEIIYRVLRGTQGRVLHALTLHHTPYSHVARSLERMHRDYQQSLTVEDLAQESAMSASSFHRAFKQVTGESPLQYLKKLRLLKAKELLVFEGKRVDEAAYGVGYASPSQFSREFKRYFDVPPTAAASLPYSDAV